MVEWRATPFICRAFLLETYYPFSTAEVDYIFFPAILLIFILYTFFFQRKNKRPSQNNLSLTPAQHLVERDLIDEAGKMEGDQSLLCAIEGTLCIKDAQVTVNSLGIARIREAIGFCKSVNQRLLCRYLLLHCAPHGKGISHFPKRRLDYFFVLGHGYFLLYLCYIVCRPRAGIKNWHNDLRRETPCTL